MKTKEYIVWGKTENSDDEQILFTKSQTLKQAQDVISLLQSKHNCKDCRVQILDLSIGFNNDFISSIK